MALSDILENLTKPAPSFLDAEDDFGDNTQAQLASKGKDEVGSIVSSKLRRQAASLLSETDVKYAGKKSSRKQIFEQHPENGDISDEVNNEVGDLDSEDDIDIESFNKNFKEKFQTGSTKELGSDGFSDHDDDMEDDDDMEEEDDDDDDGGDDDYEDEEEDEEERDEAMKPDKGEEKDIQSFSKLGIVNEMTQGKAVQSQLGMLDNFLEARIKIQRVVASMNQIPQPDTWNDFMAEGGNKFSSTVSKVQGSLCNLLNSLVELQTTVLMKNPQTQHIVTGEKAKEEDSDEEIFSDLEDEDDSGSREKQNKLNEEVKRKLTIDEFPMFVAKRAKTFESYRNSTIQKWDDKTKLSSGKMSSKSFSALDQSAMKQVKQILYDKERLIKRTQLQRSIYKIFGKAEEQKPDQEEMLKRISSQGHLKNRDPEIFDDSDFYHMLLQDYIRRKSTESSDASATTKQWMEIQQLRSKMKRKVDTRASKGRKIRYEVHKKLVNFMGPYDNSKWTQEMRDELYRSLFGQQCKNTND